MRLVLMGTGPFAVPTYRSLLESDHEVVAIVTRPVPPAGARQKTPVNPVRDLATTTDVLLLSPASVNDTDFLSQLRQLGPELLVVCDYGQILSNEALELAPLGGINLHGSLLPKYRGAAPINWAIWNGETETGVTVIHMTPGLDAGPCLAFAKTEIGPQEDAVQLEPRLAQLGMPAVHEAIEMLATWDRESTLGVLQDRTAVSKAPRLKKSDGHVDWSRSAEQIFNQVRAFKPWPSTFTNSQRGKKTVRLILDQVTVVSDSARDPLLEPGTVSACDKTKLFIATSNGELSIRKIQPAGKKSMAITEFLRGHQIQVGDRFE